jgi:Subtilase family
MSDQFAADKQPTQPAGIRDIDALNVPDSLLLDHGARVLDPVTAVRGSSGRPLRPTAYIGDTLLVPKDVWFADRFRGQLNEAAERLGLRAVGEERSVRRAERLRNRDTPYTVRVRLEPRAERAVEVDAWRLLVTLRNSEKRSNGSDGRRVADEVKGVGLNHLLAGNWPGMQGGPFVAPGGGNWPVLPSGPINQYGQPGSGARTPVSYVGAPPARSDQLDTRRPVVAILDTGLGRHPWWDDQPDPTIAVRGAELDGEPAGHTDPATDPELSGDLLGPLDGVLDSHSGHGTFIAGLVRQLCPDANLLSIRVMASDGIVDEDELIWALAVLYERLVRTRAGDLDDGHLDVVVLSLGYYHEALLDPASDAPVLNDLLRKLGELGVIVVAAAGNDATTRPMYPAAFTPHPGGYVSAFDQDVVPVISVGSRNPDASVALFSNSGPWVTTWDVGAALLSTFPVTFDGGALSSAELKDGYAQLPRRTIDPDGYASIDPDYYQAGFGTWSGTSFAAPVLAGRLAQALIDGPRRDPSIPTLDDGDQAAAVHRGWAAVQARTKLERPSS